MRLVKHSLQRRRNGLLILGTFIFLIHIFGNKPSTDGYVAPPSFDLCEQNIKNCNAFQLDGESVCAALESAVAGSYGRSTAHSSKKIPKTIHQSWKTHSVPTRFSKWSKSWRNMNPGWSYQLWGDTDNRDLVMKLYPWFLKTYDAFPLNIMRADSVRYLYMHAYGGMYADLDTFVLRPMSNLTESAGRPGSAMVGMMSSDTGFQHNIPNAWMASPPGHPFWIFLTRMVQLRFENTVSQQREQQKEINENGDKTETEASIPGAEEVTGPVVLKEAHDTWQCIFAEDSNLITLPPGYIFISDWHNDEARAEYDIICDATTIGTVKTQKECAQKYPNAHVLTFWTHSWEKPPWENSTAGIAHWWSSLWEN